MTGDNTKIFKHFIYLATLSAFRANHFFNGSSSILEA
jgi:hypothetical protein